MLISFLLHCYEGLWIRILGVFHGCATKVLGVEVCMNRAVCSRISFDPLSWGSIFPAQLASLAHLLPELSHLLPPLKNLRYYYMKTRGYIQELRMLFSPFDDPPAALFSAMSLSKSNHQEASGRLESSWRAEQTTTSQAGHAPVHVWTRQEDSCTCSCRG